MAGITPVGTNSADQTNTWPWIVGQHLGAGSPVAVPEYQANRTGSRLLHGSRLEGLAATALAGRAPRREAPVADADVRVSGARVLSTVVMLVSKSCQRPLQRNQRQGSG